MAGLVDHEAVLVDFEAFLVEDGRSAHGTAFLTHKLAELRARHRIDEPAEAAVLRHFGAHLTDTFIGLLPAPATSDPLAVDDHQVTSAAMNDGAAIPSLPREVSCPPKPTPPRPPDPESRRTQVSSPGGRRPRAALAAPATTC